MRYKTAPSTVSRSRGFTIVELLIVIVVIGILAAITIVAFNGVTQRAKNAQFLANFDSYEKLLRLYKAENGNYPSTIPDGSSDNIPTYACLGGTSYPATSNFAENTCFSLNATTANGKVIPSVNTALRTISSTLPTMDYSEVVYGDHLGYRGIMFLNDTTANKAYLIYASSKDTECGRGTKSTFTYNGVTGTLCQVTLD